MSFPRYPKYKPSGVEWLGDVPEHWAVKRFKHIFKEREERSVKGEELLLSVSAYTGVSPRSEVIDDGDHLSRADSLEGYKVCHVDDLVMNIMLAWNRGLAFTAYDGIVSPAYCVFFIVDESDPRFLNYLVRSDEYTLYFKAFSSGVIDSRLRIYPETFGRLLCSLPSRPEQSAIAAFLDRETAKIDGLVAEQRRLIELLKEKRQAVISHAVTKGLNPAAPMKPSGIDWLGDVPAHWKVVAIKHLVSTPIIDGPHVSPQKLDEGVPFISAESIGKGFIDFDKKWGYISSDDHLLYSKRYKPKRGDILLVKLGATTGVPAIVETDTDFNIWVPLAAIRLKRDIQPRFVFHVLRSNNLRVAYELNWTYGTQQTLGLGTISNLRIPIPPELERRNIVDYLDSVLPGFDNLEAEAERAIQLLQERRTALISAAVTGQIDVRGLAGSEAA
jgi:type I restriction enzyme S subunit